MKKLPGSFLRFGTHETTDGMEFTFASVSSQCPSICLFDIATKDMVEEIVLSDEDRIGDVYSVVLKGYPWKKLCYLYRAKDVFWLDPYASVVCGREQWADESRFDENYRVYGGFAFGKYQWKHSMPKLAPGNMILYKLHMRGFTMGRRIAKGSRGNDLGVLACLDELKGLGVTSLVFMPLYDFEEMMYESCTVVDEKGQASCQVQKAEKINYWGYGKGAYFAPKASCFGGKDPVNRMKKMVDAIHGNDMECIMEMSFSEDTPKEQMMECLHRWVMEYHIDGFRLVGCNVPIEQIASDPYLKDTKILYDHIPWEVLQEETEERKHLFVCDDDFCYSLRRMQNHMDGSMVQFVNQMRRQNQAYGFINYAASGSGFTLWDSYCYGEKHNLDNGEDNRDGTNSNFSCNYGHEGPTRNKSINQMRCQQMRNAVTAMLLGQGVPMLLSGDEVANSQDGNNNVYCQDNPTGWVNWSSNGEKKKIREFTGSMISFRKAHPVLTQEGAMKMNDYRHKGIPDLSYHGKEPWLMGVGDEMKSVGILYCGAYISEQEADLYICCNFGYEASEMALPKPQTGRQWKLLMNTAEDDSGEWKQREVMTDDMVSVPGSSISIFLAEEIR